MYLKQKGLKISGSKAELIDRVLTHARGNLWCQRRWSVKMKKCRRWGISPFMRRRHNLRVQWFWWLFKRLFDICPRVIWSDVCIVGRNPTSKLGMRESMGGDLFEGWGGGGVSLNITIMWGGIEINFCLMRGGGGYDLVLGHISPISHTSPPLQVIIAQSPN